MPAAPQVLLWPAWFPGICCVATPHRPVWFVRGPLCIRCDRQAPPPPARRRRLGLRHQALQFRGARGEPGALRLELLAFVEIVFGGIDERRGHAFAHFGAAREPTPERKQHQHGEVSRSWRAMGQQCKHRTFIGRQCRDCLKQGWASVLRLFFEPRTGNNSNETFRPSLTSTITPTPVSKRYAILPLVHRQPFSPSPRSSRRIGPRCATAPVGRSPRKAGRFLTGWKAVRHQRMCP